MITKWFALACMAFACLSIPCRAAEEKANDTEKIAAPAGEKKISPEADALLHRVADFYKKSKSWKTNVEVNFHLEMLGQKQDMQTSLSVSTRRPDRLVSKGTGKFDGQLLLDGTTMTVVVTQFKQYKQIAQPAFEKLKEMREVSMMSAGGLTFILPLIAADPYKEMTSDVISARIVGKDKLNGIDCEQVLFEQDPISVKIWIAQGDKPLVLKAEPDMMGMAKKQKPEGQELPEKFEFSVQINDQEFDTELDDNQFKVQLAADLKRVDEFGPPGKPSARAEGAKHSLLDKPAPDLKLDLLDGGKLDLAEHKGKDVVVLDFWATWCPPCRASLPLIVKATDAFKDKGVKFYAVNVGEKPDKVKKYVSKEKLQMNVALDQDNKGSEPFQFEGIPFTVIIDKQGIVKKVHEGSEEDEENVIKRELEEVLSGK